LGVAQGALAELETHLVLVRELYEMVISVEPENDLVSLRRMLIGLRSSIARTRISG
jgi:hypothetical protein